MTLRALERELLQVELIAPIPIYIYTTPVYINRYRVNLLTNVWVGLATKLVLCFIPNSGLTSFTKPVVHLSETHAPRVH